MNNTSLSFYLLISIFCLLAAPGCTAFQTADVKGSPSADGPYIGFRQQAARIDNVNTYSNYIDLGSGWIQGDSPYAPDGSFFHAGTSIPLHDDDPVRFGLETGKNLYYGGFNIYGRGSQRYSEIFATGSYYANFTLSKFWGDTDRSYNFDITSEMPPWMAGLRFSWYEWGRGYSFLAGGRWLPPENEQLEFEFSLQVGSDYQYSLDEFVPDFRAGISMRYFFNTGTVRWKRDKKE